MNEHLRPLTSLTESHFKCLYEQKSRAAEASLLMHAGLTAAALWRDALLGTVWKSQMPSLFSAVRVSGAVQPAAQRPRESRMPIYACRCNRTVLTNEAFAGGLRSICIRVQCSLCFIKPTCGTGGRQAVRGRLSLTGTVTMPLGKAFRLTSTSW